MKFTQIPTARNLALILALGFTVTLPLTALAASSFAAPSVPQAVDCTKSKSPERCEAREKARQICRDKRGPERRQCVRENVKPIDCAKTANPARCAVQQAAHEACKSKPAGVARRQCLRDASR